jgi:mono/diheme cytochrome c family protein
LGRRRSASPPSSRSNPVERRGRDLVVGTTCALCHAIGGTNAARAARARPHAHREPQDARSRHGRERANRVSPTGSPIRNALKPAINMPPHDYNAEDSAAIGAYLASLK